MTKLKMIFALIAMLTLAVFMSNSSDAQLASNDSATFQVAGTFDN
jgi:hypothetical protein